MNPKIVSRSIMLNRAKINAEERSAPVILASETPAVVIDWDEWKVVREILLVSGIEQPENNQVRLLDNHTYRGEVKNIVRGSIRNLRVENDLYVGDAFFSSLSEDEWTLVREGHLTDVSVGYEVYSDQTIVIKSGTTAEVNGRAFTNDAADKLDLYLRLRWRPLEGSLVPIGADEKAKFRGKELTELMTRYNEALDKIKTLEQENEQRTQINLKENSTMEPKTPEEILKAEAERRKEIRETAKRFVGRISDIETLQNDAEDKGWTVEQFNGTIVSRMSTGEEFNTPPTNLDLSEKDKKRYNIWNLVRSVHEKNPKLGEFERECSNEIAQRLNVAPNGYYIDYGYLKREITIGVGSADQLVGTELQAQSFLDLLYNKMVFGKFLNVKNIYGLVGNLQFPYKTAGSTGYYIGESDAATESNLTFASQTMSPKTVSALVKYSRQTALQTTPAMEGLVLTDISNSLYQRADRSMIQGQGTSEELLGILYADGVQTYDGSNFNFDSAVDMETLLEDANVNMDNAKWLATPLVKGALRKRKIEAGQVEKIWKKDELIERSGYATKQMPTDGLCLIDPSEIIVGTWGTLDIQINRLNDDGGVKIIPFWSHDMINRRPIGTVKITAFT